MEEPSRKDLCMANCLAGFRWAVIATVVGFLINGIEGAVIGATYGFAFGFFMSATV